MSWRIQTFLDEPKLGGRWNWVGWNCWWDGRREGSKANTSYLNAHGTLSLWVREIKFIYFFRSVWCGWKLTHLYEFHANGLSILIIHIYGMSAVQSMLVISFKNSFRFPWEDPQSATVVLPLGRLLPHLFRTPSPSTSTKNLAFVAWSSKLGNAIALRTTVVPVDTQTVLGRPEVAANCTWDCPPNEMIGAVEAVAVNAADSSS